MNQHRIHLTISFSVPEALQGCPEDCTDEERSKFFQSALQKVESVSTAMEAEHYGTFCQAWINPGDVS